MQTQDSVLFISITLMILLLLVFIYVAKQSKIRQEYPPIIAKAYKNRSILFFGFVIFGVIVTVISLIGLPYNKHKNLNANNSIIVDVTGYQWIWDVSDNIKNIKTNTPVVFNVKSADVNHGLGIYNDKLKLIAQTQAMPSYTNKLTYSFEQPGTYQFLCLELCGLAHHAMIYKFNVVKNNN